MADETVFVGEDVSDAPDQVPPTSGDLEWDDLPEGDVLVELIAGLTGKDDAHDDGDQEGYDGRSPKYPRFCHPVPLSHKPVAIAGTADDEQVVQVHEDVIRPIGQKGTERTGKMPFGLHKIKVSVLPGLLGGSILNDPCFG